MSLAIDKLVSTYTRIRARREDLKRDFKAKDSELCETQDKVKQALLEYCEEQGVTSASTESGTVSRTVRRRYWTSDWEAMHNFIIEHNLPEFLEKRLNQTGVRTFLEENPDKLPAGLNVSSEYTISVRKK